MIENTLVADRPKWGKIIASEVLLGVVLVPFAALTTLEFIGCLIVAIPAMIFKKNPWRVFGTTLSLWAMVLRHIKIMWLYITKPALREKYQEYSKQARSRIKTTIRTSRQSGLKLADAVADLDLLEAGSVLAAFAYLIFDTAILGWLIFQVGISTVSMCLAWNQWKYYDSVPHHVQPVVVPPVAYVPQVTDLQERDFGPWKSRAEMGDRVNDSGLLSVVLISDTGSIRYSQKSAEGNFKLEYSRDRVTSFKVLSTGQIEFTIENGSRFRVNPFQAFMFEGDNTLVYEFTVDGILLSTEQKNVTLKMEK